MKIFIFGGGAMGLAYAGLLGRVTSDVTLFVRRSEQADAINKNGLLLKTASGDKTARVAATANPNDLNQADIIVTLIKNYDSEHAAKIIADNAEESCVIITNESGIGVEAIYNKVCSPRKILRAVSYFGCKRLSNTSTQIGKNMNIVIQHPDDATTSAIKLINLMRKAGVVVDLSDNIAEIVWKKMVVVIAQHATSALTGMTFGQLLASKDALDLAEKLLSELKVVAEKENIPLPDNLMKLVRNNWKSLPNHKSSMYQDLISGKETEIDMMNGAIVSLGQMHNILTPYNDAITKLVKMKQSVKSIV